MLVQRPDSVSTISWQRFSTRAFAAGSVSTIFVSTDSFDRTALKRTKSMIWLFRTQWLKRSQTAFEPFLFRIRFSQLRGNFPRKFKLVRVGSAAYSSRSELLRESASTATMVKGEVIEVDIKSPVPAGFKSPAQIRLETRAQEPFSPKSFAEIQAQLENADVNRKVFACGIFSRSRWFRSGADLCSS